MIFNFPLLGCVLIAAGFFLIFYRKDNIHYAFMNTIDVNKFTIGLVLMLFGILFTMCVFPTNNYYGH